MTDLKIYHNGIVNIDSQIGQQIGYLDKAAPPTVSEADLKDLAIAIRQILTQVAQHHPTADDHQVALKAKQQIEQQPLLQRRIVGALKAGAVEILKQACQHPVAEVAIAAFEGWIKP
jgi:hypothetical protein